MTDLDPLERNLRAVLERVRAACERAGRDPAEVQLVAVTKTVEPRIAARLARLGLRDLGENRVAELERKHSALVAANVDARWHFIGHLQRNKARRAMVIADEIHSVDSVRLLGTLGRLAGELDRRPRLYLEVHLSDEKSKQGFDPRELDAAVDRARELDLPLAGLMTVAPRIDAPHGPRGPDAVRALFARLRELAAALDPTAFVGGPRLSMGMSDDFELALEEGAHVIRVGRRLFAGAEVPEALP